MSRMFLLLLKKIKYFGKFPNLLYMFDSISSSSPLHLIFLSNTVLCWEIADFYTFSNIFRTDQYLPWTTICAQKPMLKIMTTASSEGICGPSSLIIESISKKKTCLTFKRNKRAFLGYWRWLFPSQPTKEPHMSRENSVNRELKIPCLARKEVFNLKNLKHVLWRKNNIFN